mmetsp:Transcript_1872/g.4509  ORF Transcript_1872/g.4509 Transcript_1872/m.4509 type:complete len:647 (+) Transcript_1872:280-2220(+)
MQIHLSQLGLVLVIGGFLVVILQVEKLSVCVGQSTLLFGERFGGSLALRRSILGQLLIILLSILLLQLVLVNLQLQVTDDVVQQPNHSATLLLLVAADGGRRRRGLEAVGADLDKRIGLLDLLLLGELLLRRLLVLLGGIELVEPVLREPEQLESCLVLCGLLDVRLMLRLALLGCLSHGLIQILDRLLQVRDILCMGLDGLFVCLNLSVQVAQLKIQLLDLVLHLLNRFLAILLLLLVVRLLGLELGYHVVDHLEHFIETLLLALDGHQHQVHIDAATPTQSSHCTVSHVLRAFLHLQQTGARQRLLEQLQSVITVQELDGVSNREQLLGTSLLDFLVLSRLRLAGLLQLLQVPFIFLHRLGGSLQIVAIRGNFDRQFAGAPSLHFNRLGRRSDFFVLRLGQAVEVFHSLRLCLSDLLQALRHLIDHRLQNADDLIGSRSVLASSGLQESLQVLLVVIRSSVHNVLENCTGIGLQKRRRCALLDGSNSGRHCLQIRLQIGFLGLESSVVLLAHAGRLLDSLVGRGALFLMLLELLIHLLFLGSVRLDCGLKVADLLLAIGHGSSQLLGVGVAVTLKLGEELLLLLSLLLNLLLHGLQHAHHPSDGVGRGALLGGSNARGQGNGHSQLHGLRLSAVTDNTNCLSRR